MAPVTRERSGRTWLTLGLAVAFTSSVALPAWAAFGGTLITWPNTPTTEYYTGLLDEVSIFTTQLTDQQIIWHYHANH